MCVLLCYRGPDLPQSIWYMFSRSGPLSTLCGAGEEEGKRFKNPAPYYVAL
jgi:hypothetical protein